MPTAVAAPQLVAYAPDVAKQLDLAAADCTTEAFTKIFSGNHLLPGMEPHAFCYGGHQFGNWAGQLGDGRAVNLGEVINRRGQRWGLQLKGAGLTPYSRRGDGLAVLRSSLREFLCSEAMHHLGVPTTRALSLVMTGEQVGRDMFYDGNSKFEPGAVVCRVSPSFTRFGSFEIFALRNDLETLRRLADYTIEVDFPLFGKSGPQLYSRWFAEVCQRTAELMVHWMRVGFVHGVMNTDNMSIFGLTIDYGPYGWLEGYDPDWTPNTTDIPGGRYRYCNQPQIALWNLAQLANALLPLVGQTEPFEEGLQMYSASYQQQWRMMMAQKLGLQQFEPGTDLALTTELDRMLRLTETDMTIFFRCLADLDSSNDQTDEQLLTPLLDAYYQPEELTVQVRRQICSWLRSYLQRIADDGRDPAARQRTMNAVNPKYVLRNYLAQMAIDRAEAGDFSLVNQLLEVMRQPYTDQPHHQQFAYKRPEWARHRPGCSTLSCSS
ncbi:MAG: YdiU family protein [Desulfuromonas sp.]|nr:MAG: YdiU family protein [Desulfuromonas sp.]